jgi:SAM-dependent methyltransferase
MAASENARQYGDSRRLAARARLNSRYTIAEEGWFPWIARQLPLAPGARILDIGCGPGWFWAATAARLPRGLRLTLADLSPGMVEEAVARCAPLGFAAVRGEVVDAAGLSFAADSFDAVIAMHMLYHVPDPATGIAAMHRVLTPGGFLAVTTNGVNNMRGLYVLAAALGAPPSDPAAALFGYRDAERMMRERFGNVAMRRYPATLRVTDPEDVFLALTSYPPGDRAPETARMALRAAIAEAFAAGGGVLETSKESALFLSRKTDG